MSGNLDTGAEARSSAGADKSSSIEICGAISIYISQGSSPKCLELGSWWPAAEVFGRVLETTGENNTYSNSSLKVIPVNTVSLLG